MKREKVKTALRAFTYSYIDIHVKEYSHDKKKINIIKQIRDKYMNVFLMLKFILIMMMTQTKIS